VGIGQPVVAPRYQSRPFEETILSLAKQTAGFPTQNFPWASFKEHLFHRIEGLFESERGCVFTGPNEEAQLRLLEERGWWTPQHNSKDAFMQDLLKKGGWQDPSWHHNQRGYVYQNPSRKFKFFTSIQIQEILPRFSGDKSEYPFKLCLYDLPFNSDALGENIPWYQESQGFRFNLAWKTWVNINPESAEKLNIHDKDMVWVESPFGKIKALAKVFAGIMPDVLGIPLGKAETVPGQMSVEKKNDPLVLCGDSVNEHTGILLRMSTQVKIYPYTKRGIR
jgi:anaerobic selenocysteine-containing dehydrogenase